MRGAHPARFLPYPRAIAPSPRAGNLLECPPVFNQTTTEPPNHPTMNTKTLRDVDVQGKRVLMRVDFNVPVKEGKIKDDTRIVGALPSIQYVIEHGGKLVLMSHMGRPDEKGITPDTTMKIVADALAEKLGKPVAFAADCAAADAEVAALKDGESSRTPATTRRSRPSASRRTARTKRPTRPPRRSSRPSSANSPRSSPPTATST